MKLKDDVKVVSVAVVEKEEESEEVTEEVTEKLIRSLKDCGVTEEIVKKAINDGVRIRGSRS